LQGEKKNCSNDLKLATTTKTKIAKVRCKRINHWHDRLGTNQSVVFLRGGERGICLGPPLFGGPPWGITRIYFPYFWWKTYYSLT